MNKLPLHTSRLLRFFLIGTTAFCLTSSTKAQEIKELKKGEYIVLYPDGTLSAFDVLNPVHKKLLQEFQQLSKPDNKSKSVKFTEINDPIKRKEHISSLQKLLVYERQRGIKADSAYSLEKRLNKSLFAEYTKLKPSIKEIRSLRKSLRQARSAEKKAVHEFKLAHEDAEKARVELQLYKSDLSSQPPYLPLYKKKSFSHVLSRRTGDVTDKIIRQAPAAKHKRKKAKSFSEQISRKLEAQLRKLPKYGKKAPKPIKANIVKPEGEIVSTPKKINRLSALDDVMQNPPPARCSVLFEGKDDFSGKYRKELRPVTVFSCTDASMKKFYEKDDFLTCEAFFSVIENSYKYLTFQFTMASENVQPSYGWLEKDNLIQIRFLDGTTLNLYNTRTDRGTINTTMHSTSYRAYCIIGSREEKMLLKSEADAIRVQWSTGTEDYEIFDVDIFANQLKCLSSKTQ